MTAVVSEHGGDMTAVIGDIFSDTIDLAPTVAQITEAMVKRFVGLREHRKVTIVRRQVGEVNEVSRRSRRQPSSHARLPDWFDWSPRGLPTRTSGAADRQASLQLKCSANWDAQLEFLIKRDSTIRLHQGIARVRPLPKSHLCHEARPARSRIRFALGLYQRRRQYSLQRRQELAGREDFTPSSARLPLTAG